jgi:hypothetical protein
MWQSRDVQIQQQGSSSSNLINLTAPISPASAAIFLRIVPQQQHQPSKQQHQPLQQQHQL